MFELGEALNDRWERLCAFMLKDHWHENYGRKKSFP